MRKLFESDSGRFNCYQLEPCRPVQTLAEDVLKGLSDKPFSLPPKYFYDETGSELFDQICNTEEYYVTRTENQLLKEQADKLVQAVRPQHIVEFGCGMSPKSCFLFDACERQDIRCTFWPIDICSGAVQALSNKLLSIYPWLHINAWVGDYNAGFKQIDLPPGRHLALFMGSTIGNFDHRQAVNFLSDIHDLLGDNGALLLGADRIKDTEVLNAAYDDSHGLTSRFNLNLLEVLNQELEADFEIDKFRHHAFFNESRNQVEMYLVSEERQEVYFSKLDCTLSLQKGESIRTEISRKFNDEDLHHLMDESGFNIEHHVRSEDNYFSLLLAGKSGTGLINEFN